MWSRICRLPISKGARRATELLRLLPVALLLVCATAAAQQPKDSERARQAYTEGEAAYRLGRFDEAAKKYEEAYRIMKYPTILFDIAQCYRRQWETDKNVANLRKSIDLYKAFLRDAGNASKRPVAEKLVPDLEKLLAAEDRRRRQDLIARASGAEGLTVADQLISEGAFGDAATVLDRVLASRGNGRDLIVAAYGKRGVVAAQLGQKEMAQEAFKRALSLDPGYPAPSDVGAAQAYREAHDFIVQKRPLAIAHVPPGDIPVGHSAHVKVTVESDPMQMIDQLAVFYRVAGGGAYSQSRVKKDAGEIDIPAAFLAGMSGGTRVEYYVAGLDRFDGELVTLGSAREPFVFQLGGTTHDENGGAIAAESPFYRKWWFWAIVGGVAVGGGTGAYFAARGSPNNPPPVPVPTP
jgi:tetratricopeptide (TPR) repeat protein